MCHACGPVSPPSGGVPPVSAGEGGGVLPVAPRRPGAIWTVRSRDTSPPASPPARHLPLKGRKRVCHACGPVSPPSGGSTARLGRGGGRCPARRCPSTVSRRDLNRPISGTPPPPASPPARHLPLKGRKRARSRFSPQRGECRPPRDGGAVSSPWHHVARVRSGPSDLGDTSPLASPPARHLPLKGRKTGASRLRSRFSPRRGGLPPASGGEGAVSDRCGVQIEARLSTGVDEPGENHIDVIRRRQRKLSVIPKPEAMPTRPISSHEVSVPPGSTPT